MQNADDIKGTVKDYIVNHIIGTPLDFGNDESLYDRNILTSLGIIQLITYLQEECNYALYVEDIQMEDFETINKIVATIERNLKKSYA